MHIKTETGQIILSQMGRDLDSLYEKLWNAYNARTLEAFFVEGAPMFESQGEYRYSDDGGESVGIAKIKLFGNCLCLLPANAEGRRIPLCFMREPVLENFTIQMTLDTGESYDVMRLGSHTQRLYELILENRRTIRKNAEAAVRALCGIVSPAQASELARLLPDGAAAALQDLRGISPDFASALESRIGESRAAGAYEYFRGTCAPSDLYAGFKSGLAWSGGEELIWIAAVSDKGGRGTAAVEIASGEDTAAATFLYRFAGDKAAFFRRLNHTMEAVSFRREVISMPEAELQKPENALYAMAVKRTGALRFLRAGYYQRVIHRSQESWRKSIAEAMK